MRPGRERLTSRLHDPIGVVLAGGLGRRVGGSKATVDLCGRPLIGYPLAALQAALHDVAVIAKADTALPSLPGVALWIEPESPRHPVVGIVWALGFAAGRSVLACAADLPFVTPALIERIVATDAGGAPAVVPTCEGALEPLLALYTPQALPLLERAARAPQRPLRDEVAAILPRQLEVHDKRPFFNVNSPQDLLQAAAMIEARH
jgi:molybdopterin-guanine dinucleotide biosynthesis protein A